MSEPRDTVCFTCGQPAGDFPRLNCLPGGQVCPTCRDRLLESLPACLPSESEETELGEGTASIELLELDSGGDEPDGETSRGPKGPLEILHGQEPDQPA